MIELSKDVKDKLKKGGYAFILIADKETVLTKTFVDEKVGTSLIPIISLFEVEKTKLVADIMQRQAIEEKK